MEEYYLAFQNSSLLLTEFSVNSGHAQITNNYGNTCSSSRPPYINNCGLDSVQVFWTHQYGPLKPKTAMVASNLIKFDQSEYPAFSFQDEAFVYVPTACQQGVTCGLHVAFHGCTQNSENFNVMEQYVTSAGYNEWAEANAIIVLYPQVASTVGDNPNACFDWFGYTGANYATKGGQQMKAVKAMMDTLMSG